MDFSRLDAALVRANLLIAERMVDAAFTEAAERDPLVAADIAAMNAQPMPGGETR